MIHYAEGEDKLTICGGKIKNQNHHLTWSSEQRVVDCGHCLKQLESFNTPSRTAKITETEGVRQNAGKPILSPIDPKLLLEIGKGLCIGQERYGEKAFNRAGNVMKLTTCKDSLDRHVLKFMAKIDKDDLDPEDNVHHIAKAINCLVIMWHNRIQGDDRT